jgi:uncharacterized LabA/DUF88 family protein
MNMFFMDGNYAHTIAKKLNFNMDYLRLLNYVKDEYDVDRGYYYNTLISNDADVMPLRKLTDFLQHNNYTVRYISSTNEDVFKASRAFISLNMTIDAVNAAKRMDTAVFMVGTLEYLRLFDYLKDKGIRVVILYTNEVNHSISLRQTADIAVRLDDLVSTIEIV